MSNVLVLVRHGESEWNKLNLFTGWKDPGLTEKGVAEAKAAGERLKAEGLRFDVAYTSVLSRAQKTLDLILGVIGQTGLQTHKDQALNERDYGDLSGLNKDEDLDYRFAESILAGRGLEQGRMRWKMDPRVYLQFSTLSGLMDNPAATDADALKVVNLLAAIPVQFGHGKANLKP